MTDSEIIKALECCKSMVSSCEECPMHIEGAICHEYELNKKALTLINRQKAEIELWQNEYKRACAERDAHICTSNVMKSEAVKEFAERLEEYSYESMGNYGSRHMDVSVKDIDNIVKEMEKKYEIS